MDIAHTFNTQFILNIIIWVVLWKRKHKQNGYIKNVNNYISTKIIS